MKYRKKPVVIDAWPWPKIPEGAPVVVCEDTDEQVVKTLEGVMERAHGDWLIRGVKGEYYPCKPDIFEATYEAAEGER
jgi:hypothetical protein